METRTSHQASCIVSNIANAPSSEELHAEEDKASQIESYSNVPEKPHGSNE